MASHGVVLYALLYSCNSYALEANVPPGLHVTRCIDRWLDGLKQTISCANHTHARSACASPRTVITAPSESDGALGQDQDGDQLVDDEPLDLPDHVLWRHT
jgi:hypothetical protein